MFVQKAAAEKAVTEQTAKEKEVQLATGKGASEHKQLPAVLDKVTNIAARSEQSLLRSYQHP